MTIEGSNVSFVGNIGTIDGSKEATNGSNRTIEGSNVSFVGNIGTFNGPKETTPANDTPHDGPKGTIEGSKVSFIGNVGTIKGNVGTIKGNVGTIKGNVGTIKGNVGTIKGTTRTVERGRGSFWRDGMASPDGAGPNYPRGRPEIFRRCRKSVTSWPSLQIPGLIGRLMRGS